jgi:uncharacterized RDD family membrane protein YckC
MNTFSSSFQDDYLTLGVLSRRIWAFLIDSVLITLIVGVLYVIFLLFGLLTLGLGLPLLGVLPMAAPAYHFLFLAGPGSATPGQALMGLRVVRNDDLGRPTVAQALASTIGFYLTLATGAVWLLVALITTRRRTLHDLLANVVVVRTRALTAPAGYWNMSGGPWQR